MFASSGVRLPPPIRTGARVCRFRSPELLDSDRASRDARIQREIEGLRGLQRVGSGSAVIAKSVAFGGDGPANAPTESPKLSLQALAVLQRIKKERRASLEGESGLSV